MDIPHPLKLVSNFRTSFIIGQLPQAARENRGVKLATSDGRPGR